MNIILYSITGSDLVEARPECTVIDAANADAFKAAMESVLAEHGRVVLDLGAVTFIDSSGLGALISCLRRASKRRGVFVLHSLQRPVQAMFELVRMHRIFDCYADRGEALAAVTAASPQSRAS
jgi:anti-sigma B factor antagonist